jgi:hypothetical protein
MLFKYDSNDSSNDVGGYCNINVYECDDSFVLVMIYDCDSNADKSIADDDVYEIDDIDNIHA